MIHSVQPKHSLLSVKRLQRRSQTALGGWMGGGKRRREREKERDSRSLVGNDFPLFLRNVKPVSIPTSRALDPEYSNIHAGGILPCVGGEGLQR